MVPEDILLKTHEGASNTVWGLVTKALPKGMNGRVDVILNNPEHTVFYTDADGRTINGKVKGFLSLPLKKAGGGIFAEKLWKDKLFSWVKDNAPESITANMKENYISLKKLLSDK
jgi:fatty acid/phospholipid biosynthesis enzyme